MGRSHPQASPEPVKNGAQAPAGTRRHHYRHPQAPPSAVNNGRRHAYPVWGFKSLKRLRAGGGAAARRPERRREASIVLKTCPQTGPVAPHGPQGRPRGPWPKNRNARPEQMSTETPPRLNQTGRGFQSTFNFLFGGRKSNVETNSCPSESDGHEFSLDICCCCLLFVVAVKLVSDELVSIS